MTFDDFKKHFEAFNKIDTAEKLATCEKQYQQHLLHIEDQNYFEPVINEPRHDLISDYELNLTRIFSLNTIENNSFSFLAKPSFEPEHLLCIKREEDQYFATLTVLTENYWALFYANNRVVDAKKQVFKSELSKEIGLILFALLDKTISEAREPKGKSIVLDGVIYNLSKNTNNKLVTVTKHSPDPNSKSGKIIAIMEEIVRNIEQLNDELLARLKTEINNLLN